LREKLKGLAGDLNDVKDKAKEAISGSFSGALTDAITKTGEAQNAFVSLGNEIVNQIARIFSQRFTNKFVNPLIDGLLSIFPFADGGVPGGELKQYRDQVVSEPTFFGMPGGNLGVFAEAGDEAIMPLRQLGGGHGVLATGPDGSEGVLPLERTGSGALGVSLPADLLAAFAPAALQTPPAAPLGDAAQSPAYFAKGGVFGALSRSGPAPALPAAARPAAQSGDGKPDVVVNVHNNANGSEATVRESNDGGTRMIDVLIEQTEARIASNVRRGVGPLSGVMKSGGYS